MGKKKNVLLISSDHMRSDAMGHSVEWSEQSSLSHTIATPALDRLAREGVSFANAFTTNPVCVPARASITTGNYPHKCTDSKGNSGSIASDQPKLAEIFNDVGYKTYAIGKLHYVPYSPPGEPRLLHGFEHAELNEEGRILGRYDPDGKLEGLEDYHDYLKSVGWAGYERAHAVGNNDVHPAPSPMPAEHHEEAWVASRTIASLEEHKANTGDQPFLMWASFSKPHPPYDPPRPYDNMYDPRKIPTPMASETGDELLQDRDPELKTRNVRFGWDRLSHEAVNVIRSHYAGMVTFQDKQIERIIEWLEKNELLEETIIVYTSDHGDLLGDFGRFFKTCFFDGAVKVPLIWRIPGFHNAGKWRRDQLVGVQDILPTLCHLTGTTLPCSVDGEDISNVITESADTARDFYISQGAGGKYMLRTSQWKYVYHASGGVEELYDVTATDADCENLAHDTRCGEVRQQLRQKLFEWCRENEDHEMIAGDNLAQTPLDNLPAAEFNGKGLGLRKY
ncbi:MAG: sulfatase-like hydrolase/transferase [Lentisphaeria bacterium]